MAAPYPTDNPYLQNGFAPIRMECDYANLVIEGSMPADLRGTLYRIGPNPQFAPRGTYNPLQGDGMIHAFHVESGRVAYRNRWVRTRQWSLERAAGRALFATSGDPREADPEVAGARTDGVANTHIVPHAGKLLALEEGHAPIAIDPITLDTLGLWTFDGQLPGNMTAHPKIDPLTGEMVFFANFPNRQFNGDIAYYVTDASGRLVRQESMHGPFPALVHDFAITQRLRRFRGMPGYAVARTFARGSGADRLGAAPEDPCRRCCRGAARDRKCAGIRDPRVWRGIRSMRSTTASASISMCASSRRPHFPPSTVHRRPNARCGNF